MHGENARMDDYADILYLPHHESAVHPHLSSAARGAQFMPFAALTGYEELIAETSRLTEPRRVADESERGELNRKLAVLQASLQDRPAITVTYFLEDDAEAGGVYRKAAGRLRRIDVHSRQLILSDGRQIAMDDITELETEDWQE